MCGGCLVHGCRCHSQTVFKDSSERNEDVILQPSWRGERCPLRSVRHADGGSCAMSLSQAGDTGWKPPRPQNAQVTRTGRPIPTCCGCRRGTNKPSWNPMRLQSRLRQPDCEPAMSLLTRRRSPATTVAEGSDRFSVQREETVIRRHAFQSDSVSPDCEAGDVASGQAEARRRCQAEARRPPLPRSQGLFKRFKRR
jgi:hypothetical protein